MSQASLSRAPSCCWRNIISELRQQTQPRRSLTTTIQRGPVTKLKIPRNLPSVYWSQLPTRLKPDAAKRKIIIHRGPTSERLTCKDPLKVVEDLELSKLDPSGARSRLFSSENKDRARVGDVLLTTFKSGEPFSGVLLSIKSRGPHTSILLRNQLTKIGTEMLIKIHSPLVQSMEVVQRTVKRKRRARLYYLRKPEHDVGSVQKVVDQYLRQKALLSGQSRKSQYGGQQARGAAKARR